MTEAGGTMERVDVLSDGVFALDGGAMFGIVPRPLWAKALSPDSANRVTLGLNCMLVRGAGRVVLVDTGVGRKFDPRLQERYQSAGAGRLVEALAEHGIGPEGVTDVVNSHLHWDHAGGNTRRGADGQMAPAFPNARYHVQRGELEFARQPGERSRGSYRPSDYEPLAGTGQLELHDGEAEIAAGIRLHPAPGHLPHMQVITAATATGTWLFAADLIPTTHHLAPAWTAAFDTEPQRCMEVKRYWLGRAAVEGWSVIFYHDAEHPSGQVEQTAGGWVMRAVRKE